MGRSQSHNPLFGGIESGAPPLDRVTFRNEIDQAYPEANNVDDAIIMAVEDVWPAPDFRDYQKSAVVDTISNLYVKDKDVVLLSAPTGAGKSLILHAVIQVLDSICNRESFFSTPLNALIDQVDDDEFMGDDVLTLKGKNNYQCVHRQDRGTPVDKAICQRVDNFECGHKDKHPENGGCEYYGRKEVAKTHPEVVTNLSYLMANSMIPEEHALSQREAEILDECQKIEDFALGYVSVTVSKNTVPIIWDEIPRPPRSGDMDELTEWLERDVLLRVSDKLAEFEGRVELTEEQADKEEKLQHFSRRVQNLLGDVNDNHWVSETKFDNDDWSVKFDPIFVGRFMEKFLWSQGQKVVLSSATIPRGDFLKEVGLDDRSVAEVEVPSTFPPERRPVDTSQVVGKMTMKKRDSTIPKMAQKIAALARHHEGERGFIHCNSYKIAERLFKNLPHDVKSVTRVQNQKDREESLDAWLRADVDEEGGKNQEIGGQVFLSVAMDEGISLDGDSARWQVIAKAAYPFLGDKRVEYRMDGSTMGGKDWTWYNGKAAINLQQAVGRGMRSKDDWCHTYVLDKSAAGLIDRSAHLFEDWFLDAVDVEPDVGGAE